jgi:hypothetical protein
MKISVEVNDGSSIDMENHPVPLVLSAKYEIALSNITRTTCAFDACFVWKPAPLADERNGFSIENSSRRLTRSSTFKRCKLVLGLLFCLLTSVISILASPLLNLGIAGDGHDNVAPVNVNVKAAERK